MAGRTLNGDLRIARPEPIQPSPRARGVASADQRVTGTTRALQDINWLAEQLGVSYSQALRRVQQGHIAVLRLGRRIYVPVAALDVLIAGSLGADAQMRDPGNE